MKYTCNFRSVGLETCRPKYMQMWSEVDFGIIQPWGLFVPAAQITLLYPTEYRLVETWTNKPTNQV